MALIFMESFDAYGTSNGSALSGILNKWASSSLVTNCEVAAGRIGGKSVLINSSFQRNLDTPTFAVPTITVGFAFRFTSLGSGGGFLELYEGANLGINVRLTATGELAVYLNNSQLDITSGLGLTANTWLTIELSVTVDNSAGSYDLRVNGITRLSDRPARARSTSRSLARVGGHSVERWISVRGHPLRTLDNQPAIG